MTGGEERRDAETWRRQEIQQVELTGQGAAVGTRKKREKVHEDFWVWARGERVPGAPREAWAAEEDGVRVR